MIGILSDSHDNLEALRRAVILFQGLGCELVIHAGDFIAPFAANELANLGCPVKGVFGNCDGEREGLLEAVKPFGEIREEPFSFEYKGLKILLTHRHEKLPSYVKLGGPDTIIFGHTHKPEIRTEKGILLINPGEAGGWVSGKMTVAVLDPITRGAEIVSLT